jgi:hypothetical protein
LLASPLGQPCRWLDQRRTPIQAQFVQPRGKLAQPLSQLRVALKRRLDGSFFPRV